MAVTQFTSSVGFSIIFPFLPLYIAEIGSTSGLGIEVLSGLVYSVQAITMALASPIWGAVADRYGRKAMVVRAGCGGGLIILLMAFVQNAEQLIVLRAVQGVITGVIAASSALVASVVPRERTGYAMGLLQLGQWCGVAAGPLIGGILSDLFGFRTTFTITALILFLSGLAVWVGMREPFRRSKQVHAGPLGFLADWGRVLSNRQLDYTLMLRFLNAVGRSAVEPILPLFVLALVASPDHIATSTGLVVGAASAASTLTSVYLGRLGDRAGHARVALGSGIAAALFYSSHVFVGHLWQLFLLYSLAGAAVGGLLPSLAAMLAANSESGDEGCVYGIDNSVTSLGRTVGPVLSAVCALWFSARMTFLFTGCVFATASLLASRTVCRSSPQRPSRAA
jgi:MFS transporter, DHA1 family, multidrug resistance protein